MSRVIYFVWLDGQLGDLHAYSSDKRCQCIHSFEIGLVLFVVVIPVRVTSVAIAMVVVLLFYEVLKDEKLSAFGHIERLKPDVFVKHFEAPLFVHFLFG